MLLRLIRCELMKWHRSPVWLAFLFLPILPALLGTLNYMGNLEILQDTWYSLWTQHTLFSCYFFLPVLVGIYSSYLMHLEVAHNNWNKYLSLPISKGEIFLAKFFATLLMIFFCELWICTLFVISGKIIGLIDPIPWQKLLIWCSFGTLGGGVMASIQLLLSLFFQSFALPVGIALGGGLSGLLFLAKGFGHLWPYALMAYGMNSNAPQELSHSGYGAFILTCVIYILLFTVLGSFILKRKEP